MRLEVEVALVGNPNEPISPGVLDESFFKIPYAKLRRVQLRIDENESLAGVMEHAAMTMGLRELESTRRLFDSNRIAFYKPEDEEGIASRGIARVLSSELILVDQDGRAIFGVYDHRSIRFRDLIRASKVGALEGDPLRPYLMVDFGWGDAPPPDWIVIQQVLDVTWDVIKSIGVVGGAVVTIIKTREWLVERLGRAREALASHPEWMQKKYRPDQFEALISIRDWTAAELTPLLGCSEKEAEAVLWALGYVFDSESQQWIKRFDVEAQVLSDIQEAAAWLEIECHGWETRFRKWLYRYLETGNQPPFEMLRPNLDDTDLEFDYRPTIGERLDSLLGLIRRHK